MFQLTSFINEGIIFFENEASVGIKSLSHLRQYNCIYKVMLRFFDSNSYYHCQKIIMFCTFSVTVKIIMILSYQQRLILKSIASL